MFNRKSRISDDVPRIFFELEIFSNVRKIRVDRTRLKVPDKFVDAQIRSKVETCTMR